MGGAEHLVKSNKRVVEGGGGGVEISVGQRGGGWKFRQNKKKRPFCKRDPISSLNSPRIQTCNTLISIFNIGITT